MIYRVYAAALLCAALSIQYAVAVSRLVVPTAHTFAAARPTATVFALVGLAIYAVPAIGFGVAAWRLRTRLSDVAWLALVFSGADGLLRVFTWPPALPTSAVVLRAAWLAADVAILVLTVSSWRAFVPSIGSTGLPNRME